MTTDTTDGREAYRDDPDYTAPVMEPRANPDDVDPQGAAPGAVSGAAGLSIGTAGGTFAGQVIADEYEERERVAEEARESEAAEQSNEADADR